MLRCTTCGAPVRPATTCPHCDRPVLPRFAGLALLLGLSACVGTDTDADKTATTHSGTTPVEPPYGVPTDWTTGETDTDTDADTDTDTDTDLHTGAGSGETGRPR